MKIITLVPTRGILFTQMVNSLVRELQLNNQPIALLTTDNLPIPDCRNALVEEGLKHDVDYFLMVDDDVVIPEGGLKAMIDADTDIAFIDYPMHYDKGRFKNMGTACYDDWVPGEDTKDKPLKWAGLGCVLAKTSVFKKLGKPWFQSMHKQFVRDDKGHMKFIGELDNGEKGGEDVYFFLNAMKEGFKVKRIDMTAGHARIEKFVFHLQSGKYATQHKIKINEKIDQPYR